MIVEALPSKCVTTISADTNKSISNNFVKSNNVENESNSAKKKISNENALNMNNSIQLDCNLGSLYGIKKYISSLTADQNRTQELYQAQTTSQNVTSNVSPNKQLEITSVYNDQNISNKTQSPKPNSQQPNSKVTESYQLNIQLNQQTENDMFESETSENHSKNVTVSMMDPNSVPDIIPVENVSQSLSQNSSDRCLFSESNRFHVSC
ncbi:uncharacterized protein LOC124374199 [Homalodisca vitripennis]|uniref:uncharacterized protein LOC124374199 n=1 Tax=Homalodisca vitripennis TaxID=197043 RepID=UPI001EEBEEED|nr:uncharacterized protein LOC124374199 [Homalodisca vitripennis]